MNVTEQIAAQREHTEQHQTVDVDVQLGGEIVLVAIRELRADRWYSLIAGLPPRPGSAGDRTLGLNENALPKAYPVDSVRINGGGVSAESWAAMVDVLDVVTRQSIANAIIRANVLTRIERHAERGNTPPDHGTHLARELGISPRRFYGWEPAEVTRFYYDDAGRLSHAVTTREPEFGDADRIALHAARDEQHAPRGRHGILLSDATDPAKQYRWKVPLPTLDFAQAELDKTKARYLKAYPDVDADALLWRVELDTPEGGSADG